MIITPKQFKALDNVIKAIKCPFFIIFPDKVIGSDSELVTLTMSPIVTNIEIPCEFEKKQWDEIYKTLSVQPEINTMDVISQSIWRLGTSPTLIKYQNMKNYIDSGVYFFGIEDLNADEKFMQYASLKAADGAIRYVVDRQHIIFNFAGFLPLLKKDKIGINIYDIPNVLDNFGRQSYFLTEFYINKGPCIVYKYVLNLMMY